MSITKLDTKVEYIPPETGELVALRAELSTCIGEAVAESQTLKHSIIQILQDQNRLLSLAQKEAKRGKDALKEQLQGIGLVK
jgi:hypothetical protein